MSITAPTTFGPYLVHEEVGTGGMATVHRAELPGIEGFSKAVALKRMLPTLAENEEIVQAFVREARLASYLHHSNVAQTYELGNIDGTYFIAMELINGRSLQDMMMRSTQLGVPMPVEIALAILNQVLDALDYAHNLCDHAGQPLGIIHRDVSPSNIILAEGGIVKLIDFGIAKASAVGMQTQSVTLKGKFAYMAPEYVYAGQIDARADLFAVGVIAHELLANQPLFSASQDMETLSRLRSMEIPTPSSCNPRVPADIDHVVMTALARDPAERWQQASAMRNALAVVAKRLGLVIVPAQIGQWLDGLFAPAAEAGGLPVAITGVPSLRATPPAGAPVAAPPAGAPAVHVATPPAGAPAVRVATPPAGAPVVHVATPPAGSPVAPAVQPPVLPGLVAASPSSSSLDRGPDYRPVLPPAPRRPRDAQTGAEPLWEPVPAPTTPSPSTPAFQSSVIAVTVHDKKRYRRWLTIVAVALAIVGIAAVGYFVFGLGA